MKFYAVSKNRTKKFIYELCYVVQSFKINLLCAKTQCYICVQKEIEVASTLHYLHRMNMH